MTKLIIANWKMNGSLEMAHDFCHRFTALARDNASSDFATNNTLVLCPSHSYLSFVAGAITGTDICLGAQDCSGAQSGAYTGETNADMLKDVGCSYVIIGHSERRQNHQESNELLTSKIEQALQADLFPIFCVGESEVDYENNSTQDVLSEQLKVLENFKGNDEVVVAYEPVWAIGTGKVPTNSDIEKTCAFIHEKLSDYNLKSLVLYGGSVKSSNAKEILSLQAVDGVLVGGASLKPDEFWKISIAV